MEGVHKHSSRNLWALAMGALSDISSPCESNSIKSVVALRSLLASKEGMAACFGIVWGRGPISRRTRHDQLQFRGQCMRKRYGMAACSETARGHGLVTIPRSVLVERCGMAFCFGTAWGHGPFCRRMQHDQLQFRFQCLRKGADGQSALGLLRANGHFAVGCNTISYNSAFSACENVRMDSLPRGCLGPWATLPSKATQSFTIPLSVHAKRCGWAVCFGTA